MTILLKLKYGFFKPSTNLEYWDSSSMIYMLHGVHSMLFVGAVFTSLQPRKAVIKSCTRNESKNDNPSTLAWQKTFLERMRWRKILHALIYK